MGLAQSIEGLIGPNPNDALCWRGMCCIDIAHFLAVAYASSLTQPGRYQKWRAAVHARKHACQTRLHMGWDVWNRVVVGVGRRLVPAVSPVVAASTVSSHLSQTFMGLKWSCATNIIGTDHGRPVGPTNIALC